jgi:hypothetical protein
MLGMFAVWLLIAFAAGYCVIYREFFQVDAKSITDVIALARPVGESEIADLLNSKVEANLRESLSKQEFRNHQKLRLRIILDCLRRMGFNAMLILSWAYAEQERLSVSGPESTDEDEAINEAIAAGIQFRFYFVFTLPKLLLCHLIGLYTPRSQVSLTILKEMSSVDGLVTYRRLMDAARAVSLRYGPQLQERMTFALSGAR